MTVKLAALQRRADELEERENKLTERERNFKATVRKEAQSIIDRERTATATLEQLENQRKQNERANKILIQINES